MLGWCSLCFCVSIKVIVTFVSINWTYKHLSNIFLYATNSLLALSVIRRCLNVPIVYNLKDVFVSAESKSKRTLKCHFEFKQMNFITWRNSQCSCYSNKFWIGGEIHPSCCYLVKAHYFSLRPTWTAGSTDGSSGRHSRPSVCVCVFVCCRVCACVCASVSYIHSSPLWMKLEKFPYNVVLLCRFSKVQLCQIYLLALVLSSLSICWRASETFSEPFLCPIRRVYVHQCL